VIQLVVDVNLSPLWIDVFVDHGWPAVHWSTVGDPRAKDRTVMAWARENGRVVFTHDLDFGTLLALTRETGPSVVQVRATMYSRNTSGRSSSRPSGPTSRSCSKARSSRWTNRVAECESCRSGRRENSRTHATSGALEPSRSPDACTPGSQGSCLHGHSALPARVAVTPARTLSIVPEEFERREKRPMTQVHADHGPPPHAGPA
jgi:predicted nuclease of predicted toxin-antitoxin system